MGRGLSVAAQEGREALPRCVGDGREVVDAEAGPRLHRRLDHAQRQPSDEARHVEAVLPALTNPRPNRRAGERVVTHPGQQSAELSSGVIPQQVLLPLSLLLPSLPGVGPMGVLVPPSRPSRRPAASGRRRTSPAPGHTHRGKAGRQAGRGVGKEPLDACSSRPRCSSSACHIPPPPPPYRPDDLLPSTPPPAAPLSLPAWYAPWLRWKGLSPRA